jgi:hypothetical protein
VRRTETVGFSICQPFIEVAHTPPGDSATKTLQQRVSKGESLVLFENVPKCVEFVWLELIRGTEAEPTYVDALDACLSVRRVGRHWLTRETRTTCFPTVSPNPCISSGAACSS